MKDPQTTPQTEQSLWRQVWERAVSPSRPDSDMEEHRVARLATGVLFVSLIVEATAALLWFGRTGFPAWNSFPWGVGLIFLFTLAAYIVTKTGNYRAGIVIFTVAYSSMAHLLLIVQRAEASQAMLILMFVVPGLILASSFLSSWILLVLASLNTVIFLAVIAAVFSLSVESVSQAAMILFTGFLLSLLARFRSSIEKHRLDQVQATKDELAHLAANLELRVEERTRAMDAANRELAQRAAQLHAITQLSEAIAQLQDLNQLLSQTTRLISEYFGFYHVGIFLIDDAREFAVLQAANSEGGKRMLERGHRLRLGTGVVGHAALTGKPRIALDVGKDAVFFNNPDLPQTRSEAALPMISGGDATGILDVQSLQAEAFSTEDLQTLTALANQVAIAIENTRLLTETRATLVQLQKVYDEFTRTEWSRTIARADQPGFRFHMGRIEMLEKGVKHPDIVAAARRGETITVTGEGGEKGNTIAVPVKIRGEVIGVLHLESSEPSRQWLEEEISLVEAVAERAAFAMENARLFQDARRRAIKEQSISEATARISSAMNIENILHTTAEELERALGVSEVVIRFWDRE